MNTTKRRWLAALAAVCLLTAGTGWLVLETVLPYAPIRPYRQNPEYATWRIPRGASPADYGLQAEPLTFRTHDGLTLHGWFVPAQGYSATGATVVVLHGISSCKEFFLPAAEVLAQRGINTVLFDLRAHGASEGDYCTFGAHETRDVSVVLDTLLARDSTLRIGIMGHSLGGAIALQALAADPRLRFGVVESTFHSLEKVVEEYGDHWLGIRSAWLAHEVLERSGEIACFDPFQVMPAEAATAVTQPVFMAHGDRDERIPLAFGQENFRNLASPAKQWYTIQGAGHNLLWQAGGPAYVNAVVDFIRRQAK